MLRNDAFALGLSLAFLTGCGPSISTYLIVSAQAELDGAKAADAQKYAIYEYTAAEEYLQKAREEQGYADFGPAIDYAYKAQELAKKATERAEKEKTKLRGPDAVPADYEPSHEGAEPQPDQPKVIIKKKTEVEVVPIPTDEGTRPPE